MESSLVSYIEHVGWFIDGDEEVTIDESLWDTDWDFDALEKQVSKLTEKERQQFVGADDETIEGLIEFKKLYVLEKFTNWLMVNSETYLGK